MLKLGSNRPVNATLRTDLVNASNRWAGLLEGFALK